MFRKILVILLLSACLKNFGQETISFRFADSLTYSQYVEKSWADLIRTGREAIRSGHDYYYMRMRIGIAFYERHNYAMSAHHFRKALEMNANDQIALEYLFYSHLFSGRRLQAWSLTQSFYPQNRERIIKESRIRRNTLSLESFYSDPNTGQIINDPGAWFKNPEPGSQIVTDFFLNNSVSASHIAGRHVNYYHSFTNLLKDNYLHYFDGTYYSGLYPQRVIQNQYYGAFSFFTSSGWIFTPSFHIVTASYPLIYFSTQGMNPVLKQYYSRSYGGFTGLSISKSFGYLATGIEAGYTGFYRISRMQGTFSAMLYPLGNSRFYMGGKISVIKSPEENFRESGLVKGLYAGFSIAGRVWIELSGLSGDMAYYADNNGLYIYNTSDVLKTRLLSRIIVPFNKIGLTLFAGAGIYSYSSDFIPADGDISVSLNNINYKSKSYTGGLSWNF